MSSPIFLDIETDGLKPSVIWVAVTMQDGVLSEHYNAESLSDALQGDFNVIGHNLIGFDLPVLERLWGISVDPSRIVDTLVLSRLACPDRPKKHSLESWGDRLGFCKGDHEDWSCLSLEMLEYCKRDVQLTEKVYQTITFELRNFSLESIELEHAVARVIQKQVENGWLLDVKKASLLLCTLKERLFSIQEEVKETFKPLATFVKEVEPKVKKDGSVSIVGLKFLGDRWVDVCGPLSRIDYPEFNLGSRQQIARHLQHFGWEPKQRTETDQPQVDEKVLSEIQNIPQAKLISEYLMIQKRIAMVNSWIESAGDDDRVHGAVNSNGTVTGRMTHSKPNVAQVPATRVPYGEQCRQCWIPSPGYDLVGFDASGLELRMLANYMEDKAYINEIINGDIHTANQELAGLESRDSAKTFIYALLYGAGDEKLGSVVGAGRGAGAALRERFMRNLPAFADLKNEVSRKAASGFLEGLDGRRLAVRSEHAALNTLLQSAGGIVMKKALTLLSEYAKIWNIDYKFIGNIHDEIQSEVRPSQATKFGHLAVRCIQAAGRHFGLQCPLDGEFKVGRSWAETH